MAQSATYSVPFSVGRGNCTSGSSEIHYYHYTGNNATLADIAGDCQPLLKRGTSNFTFQRSMASVSYNPRNQYLYYLYTELSPTPRTWVWGWPVGTCPTSSSNASRLDTIAMFNFDILGVTFDKEGNGYMLEFSSGSAPYTMFLRSIDFSTRTIGPRDTLQLTEGSVTETGSGDIAMSPSGQMYFVVQNQLYTPDYKSYGQPGKITTTFLGTVTPPSPDPTTYMVGLTFADGKLITAYNTSCAYRERDPLTGEEKVISRSGSQSTADFASILSGVGAAKQLVGYTPTGTPNQYDVEYDVVIKNMGNYPITSVSLRDTLSRINGAANFSLNSVTFVENPAGLVLNAGYNGSTNTELLSTGGSLPNYPTTNNYARIRISVRLSNIQPGIVYFNQAFARARGYNNTLMLDASTNGLEPDLNSNDKPDDAGENQPTPFLLSITAYTPPCPDLKQVLYFEDFGNGGNTTSLSGIGNSPSIGYTGSTANPMPNNRYALTNNPSTLNSANWLSMGDHTSGSGRMLAVNADAEDRVLFSDELPVLCANQQYSLFFYAAFPANANYATICDAFGGFHYPKLLMRIKDKATGAIISQIESEEITTSTWNQYGMKFVMPSGFSNIVFEIVNAAPGGCGNDVLLDDIQFGLCDPAPTVFVDATTAGCLGSPTSFAAFLNDNGVIPGTKDFQWQVSSDNVNWTNITGATDSIFTIASVGATDINMYYRVIVAAAGNMGSGSCQYVSPGYLLNSKAPSVKATSAWANLSNICPGTSVILRKNGGTLGDNAQWVWYEGSCGGTPIGYGESITVTPSATTTYYVRAEGDCNVTDCEAVTVVIACDIDKDKDGIPDIVESGGVDPFLDHDGDGILNYMDADFPGFVDVNSDGINDNFDWDLDGIINALDLDSDNDGIPDVVESGGVDANGDGRIDNFSDADNDGLSDNVDASSTGHLGSGAGLGLPDDDGDGIPNMFDLDSDNDGIPDVVEAGGTDANNDGMIDGYTDTDNDGFSDNVDGDVGNDGIAENSANALLRTGADTNGDGRADSYPYKNMDGDSRANPYDLDSDGDGITDVREAGFTDADSNGFIDGAIGSKGWNTAVSSLTTLNLRNSDGDANPDYLDIDSDNDGITDNVEGLSTSSYRLPLNTDADNDGIDDRYDTFVGFGGNGITPNDQDGDGIPDYIDTDTDNDGVLDIVEGNDFNRNCSPDDLITLTGTDTDGDGLDDRFDLDNTSAKVTSAFMGNFGSMSGDATPGHRSALNQCDIGGSDRDWRYQPYALDASFIYSKVHQLGRVAHISWMISCEKPVHHFDIEHSTDGLSFDKIAEVAAPETPLLNAAFTYQDKNAVTGGVNFYRIKAVTHNGFSKTSMSMKVNVEAQATLMVAPNPAASFLNLSIASTIATTADIRILDGNGQIVKTQDWKLQAGSNSITIQGLQAFSNGVYHVQINIDGVIHTRRFIVRR